MTQEFHAVFCDADLDSYKSDKVIRDRLYILKQQLQHQINDEYQFDGKCPCLRHNLSPPCKIKNCPWRHVCRCGASDHIMTDKHCPNHHMDDEKFFKKIKGMKFGKTLVKKWQPPDATVHYDKGYDGNTWNIFLNINSNEQDALHMQLRVNGIDTA